MTTARRLAPFTGLLVAGVLAACGGTSVGNSNLASFTVAPTTASAAPSSAAATPTAAPPTAPPASHPTATAKPAANVQTLAIAINPDSAAPAYFDPTNAGPCPAGTRVTWTNHDSQPRSVVAQDGAFNSGPIAPGASWTWTATSGNHAYADGTRNYATATVSVQ